MYLLGRLASSSATSVERKYNNSNERGAEMMIKTDWQRHTLAHSCLLWMKVMSCTTCESKKQQKTQSCLAAAAAAAASGQSFTFHF